MADSLRDPEREMEELGHPINEPVQAHNLKQAKTNCEKLARQYERKLTDVRPEGRSWFRCFFE
ncbi:MAG: hypothetical protein F6J92_12005 [Symploca sp. SIO1A3]|nr:hypothetical protein [Symploca sp. SIO1A3]